MTMDSIRGLVQLVSGLGEMTKAKANDTARDLAALAGLDEQLKDKKLRKQVSALAQELMETASSNREQVVSLVRAEIDKALARADLAKIADLDAAKATLAALVVQVEDLSGMVRSALPGGSRESSTPAAVVSLPTTPAAEPASPEAAPAARKRPARRSFATAEAASVEPTPITGKAPAKKAPAKKAPAKKAPAKKAPAKKTVAKKTVTRKTASPKADGS